MVCMHFAAMAVGAYLVVTHARGLWRLRRG